jgi:tetratricopeptide (TPR) repeat protein
MEKDPARRYPDGAAFADDLSRARRGEPILATRPGAVSLLARGLRRRIVPVAAIVAGLAIAGAALTIASSRTTARLSERLAAAARAEDDGRLEDARDAYRGALAIADDDKARRGIARVEAALAKRAEARDLELRTAQARLEAQGRAARLLEQGRPSLDRALALLSRSESDVSIVFREANAALDLFRRAELEAPSHAHAPYLSGRALDALGDPDGAEAAWRRAIELDPNFGPARFLLGRARLVRAFLASCYTRTKPDAEAGATKAAEDFDAATRAGSGFDDEILREVARAMSHYVRGDRASAKTVCEKAVAAFGTRPGVEELLWVLAISAEPADATAHYDRCLALRPHHAAALLGRGLAFMQLGRYGEAERDFQHVAQLWPRSRDAWNCLGTARHAAGRLDDAIVDYGRAIEIDRTFVHALSNRALAHVHRADRLAAAGRQADAESARQAALKDYDHAIAADPAAALPRNGRGALRMAAGAVEDALADFNEAVRIDPLFGDALVNRAIARRTLGDADGALRDLDLCIEKHPNHVAALQQRSTLRYTRQDLDGAIADLDRVIALGGGLLDFCNRGAFRLMKGRPKEAIDDFTQALERRPRHLDALHNRAIARVQLEQWQGALDDVEAALAVAPADWKSRAQAERLRELARSRLKQ